MEVIYCFHCTGVRRHSSQWEKSLYNDFNEEVIGLMKSLCSQKSMRMPPCTNVELYLHTSQKGNVSVQSKKGKVLMISASTVQSACNVQMKDI